VKVTHVNAAGPIARLELVRTDNGELLSAEIRREDHAELGLERRRRSFRQAAQGAGLPARVTRRELRGAHAPSRALSGALAGQLVRHAQRLT
jgi:hypothetical protein